MRTTIKYLLALALLCIGLSQETAAVSPPPDGGYPGGNTAEGQNALFSLTTGGYNTAVGFFSLRSDIANSFNTAIGAGSLLANMGDQNTAIGAGALFANTTAIDNTAAGAFALFNNVSGGENTATGHFALFSNNVGALNTASGEVALVNNTNGTLNTAIGASALANSTTGSDNVALGGFAGSGVMTASNVICIGANVTGADVDNSCYIGQIFNAPSAAGIAVFINSDGKLGTATSSRRFKQEIKPMEQASEVLFELKPVTFRYEKKIDPARKSQFGLVAEDVAKVNPDLIVRDKEGKPYSVRYDQVNAMLLNEFLKEHRRVDEQAREINEQKAAISDLRKTIQSIVASLKEQRTQIQKVTARFPMSEATTQVVSK